MHTNAPFPDVFQQRMAEGQAPAQLPLDMLPPEVEGQMLLPLPLGEGEEKPEEE